MYDGRAEFSYLFNSCGAGCGGGQHGNDPFGNFLGQAEGDIWGALTDPNTAVTMMQSGYGPEELAGLGDYLIAKPISLVGDLGDLLGPSGSVFGRTRLGGSSLLNINNNESLRIGWSGVGDYNTGTNVFRISGDWLDAVTGVENSHIDLFKASPPPPPSP